MFSRRKFVQGFTFAGGLTWLWAQRIWAADSGSSSTDTATSSALDNCEAVADPNINKWDPASMGEILFLAGGYTSDKSSDLTGRGHISFLIKSPQTPSRHITKVILTDSTKNKLGIRYLDQSDRLVSGFPPYLVFNNINLSVDNQYFLYIQMNLEGVFSNFRFTLAKSDVIGHVLDGPFLPAKLRVDLRNASYASFFSTPFWIQDNGMIPKDHVIRAQLLSVTQDSNFQLRIFFPAADKDATQFNRYFFATDPVGRLLGIAARKFGDPQGAYLDLTALTQDQLQTWGMVSDNVAKIRECPYILIFVDDAKEALSMGTLWLR